MFNPTDEQVAILEAYRTGGDMVVEAGAGTGKALRNDQPVVTPDGYRPIGELEVGDLVAGSDGRYTRVTGVYPQGEVGLVEITFTGGTKVVASLDHLWACQTNKERDKGRGWKIRTTGEIIALLEHRPTKSIWLPMPLPVEGYDDADLPIDPWLLGAILGDGGLTSGGVSFSNKESSMLEAVSCALPETVSLVVNSPKDGEQRGHYRLSAGPIVPGSWSRTHNVLVMALRGLELIGCGSADKFIPDVYMRAGIKQRIALLQGLLDTDGCIANRSSGVEWGTVSPRLAEQVRYLVYSLGGIATMAMVDEPHFTYKGETRSGQPFHRFYIRTPAAISPFLNSHHKAAAHTPYTKYPPSRRIMDIVPVARGLATCISVDSPDRLFLTADCLPTHNTRSVQMLAESDPNLRVQFCAFNKSVVVDATERMPGNTTCNTVHSLAFRSAGTPFARRLNSARMPGRELARRLGTTGLKIGEKWLSDAYLASLATRGVVRFCQTADPEPAEHHIPYVDGIDEPENGKRGWRHNRQLRAYLAPFMSRVWEDAINVNGELPYRHDFYVKLAQLRGMYIATDVVMVDEAQDISPVFASLVDQQRDHAQIVAIGDSNQSIYGSFTGAIDYLQQLDAQHRLMLSQSFRFGPAIASLANELLAHLPTELRLRGLDSIPSRIGRVDAPDAYLYRTNAGAVGELIRLMDAGVSAHLMGGANDVVSFARAASDLIDGRRTSHQELACFESWFEVQDYVKSDAMGDEIKLLVSLIDRFGPATIVSALERMPGAKTAKVILSTAHKSKGLQFQTVRLGGDFPSDLGLMQDEEVRLMYVAVTRAQLVLDTHYVGCLSTESMEAARQAAAMSVPVAIAA